MVDWGEDEEFLTDEIAEDEHFLEDENLNPTEIDSITNAQIFDQLSFSPPDQAEINKGTLVSDTPDVIPDQPSSTIASRQIKKSDRNKKLSGRWNEEAGFVPHRPRSFN